MKTIITLKAIFIALLVSTASYAVPVLNQNMAADGTNVVIWPDHQDPDQFYYAPSMIRLSKDSKGAPKFSLARYRTGCTVVGIGCKSKAMVNALLIAEYSKEMAAAQNSILKLRPKARFSTIPMFDGQVQFNRTVRSFVDAHDCSPRTGQPSDEIPCSITLNKKGMRTLIPFLAEGKTMAFQFQYRIEGVSHFPDQGFKEASTSYGVAVALGGEELEGHEDLQ